MKANRRKLIAIIFFAIPFLLFTVLNTTPATAGNAVVEEPAAAYKTKCAACHLPNGSKFYDAAKPDEEHVKVILKGKKGEKPPFMPGFEAKGMTEDEAKGLAAYMRGLKTPK
jgi:mono/diheme cytochrome c family protein